MCFLINLQWLFHETWESGVAGQIFDSGSLRQLTALNLMSKKSSWSGSSSWKNYGISCQVIVVCIPMLKAFHDRFNRSMDQKCSPTRLPFSWEPVLAALAADEVYCSSISPISEISVWATGVDITHHDESFYVRMMVLMPIFSVLDVLRIPAPLKIIFVISHLISGFWIS